MTHTFRTRIDQPTKLVRMTAANGSGRPHGIVDGATVNAARFDGEGTATGTVVGDHMDCLHALFAEPIAAGGWDLAVTVVD